MSAVITEELRLLGACVVFGMGVAAAYEPARLSRLLFRHGRLWTGIEDLLFWIFCAVQVFGMILRTNDGTIRWYALAGCAAGAGFYQIGIHRLLVFLLTPVWQGIQKAQSSRRNRLKSKKKSAKIKEKFKKTDGRQEREVHGGRIREKEEKETQNL